MKYFVLLSCITASLLASENHQNARTLRTSQLLKLRDSKKKLEAVNSKLEPIEAALPEHLKRIIEHHQQLIQVSELREPARKNYLLYVKALKARKVLEDRIAALNKELQN